MHLQMISRFFLLSLIFTISAQAGDPAKNYQLSCVWQKSAVSLFALDVNAQTPGHEIIAIYGNQLDVLTNVSRAHQKSIIIPADRKYHITPLPGVSSDSLRLLFRHQTATTAAFDLYFHRVDSLILVRQSCLFFSGQDRDHDGLFHQSISPIGMVKDQTGNNRVLLNINSGGDAGVRGIIALDPVTGHIDWQYLTGPLVIQPMLIDIDDDGIAEIIFGSYAPLNGVKLNGTSDDSCYIFVLDSQGNQRWRKTMGPYWTGAYPIIGDMTGDGNNELVVFRFGSNPDFTGYDELIRLDIRNGAEIQRKSLGSYFTPPFELFIDLCHDFDGDGIEEFVIGSKDGFVRMYSGDFSVMYTSEPYRRPITVHGVADLDGDGLLELIAITADKKIVFLNHQLKQLLIQPFPDKFSSLRLIKLPHKHQLLFSSLAVNNQTENQLFDFRVVGLADTIQKQGQNYLIVMLILAALVVAVLVVRNLLYGKRAHQLLLQILEQSQSLDSALIMDRYQKISFLGKDWSKLLQILPHQAYGKKIRKIFNNSRLQPIGEALQKMLAENLTNYECLCPIDATDNVPLRLHAFYLSWTKAHCFLIFDLREQEHIRKVRHWATVAQKLAHGIKNPLTTVKLNAEELLHKVRTTDQIQANEVEEFITPIISQVAKLKKMSDGFMRFVEFERPNLKPVDLNGEIKELVLQWKTAILKKIEVEWDLEEKLTPAMLDREQFEYAVKNVLYNAADSIQKQGKILISTRKVQVLSDKTKNAIWMTFVELQIRDTGCGIPAEYLDRIRQPYFSYNKPEGTGLGLSIVEKIIDTHGGQLEIQSDVNIGTTVSLRFKPALS